MFECTIGTVFLFCFSLALVNASSQAKSSDRFFNFQLIYEHFSLPCNGPIDCSDHGHLQFQHSFLMDANSRISVTL